jgi:hypothetical protein
LTYARESRTLDNQLLGVIDDWRSSGASLDDDQFNALALRLFGYQLRYNQPYAQYCESLGVRKASQAPTWQAIVPVPATAFKDAVLATFEPSKASLIFETSGTTIGRPGRHYFESSNLYDAAAPAAFDRFVLPDGARLRYLNLVPNPAQRAQSSLGYMMQQVSRRLGDGHTGWYVHDDLLAFDEFCRDVQTAIADGQPVCIATTAFALVHVLDRLEACDLRLPLPPGSRIMETGGFKGRTRAIEGERLYERTSQAFEVPLHAIVAEYGMTELTTQYYDAGFSRADSISIPARRKSSPPWLRTRVVAANGSTLPPGTVGALVHVDLANRASCIAIATDDLGVQFADDAGGLILIGRERGAALRGCSLDAESLLPR